MPNEKTMKQAEARIKNTINKSNNLLEEKHNYEQILKHNMNLIFVIRQENDRFYFSLLAGKLKEKLDLSDNLIGKNADLSILDHGLKALFKEKIQESLTGKEVSFRHTYQQCDIYSMLSPIVKNGQVIEIVGTSIDITSFKKAEQEIEYLRAYDRLTNLPNRDKLLKDLDESIKDKKINPLKALIMCDLDRLKNINDTLGQYAGDQVISLISERLLQITPRGCKIYRFGGDEFVIVMDQTIKDISRLAEEILHIIRQPFVLSKNDFYMTGTIGISYMNESVEEAEEYINRASVAVHYGKVKGGNRVIEYNNQMSEKYNEILLLESDIRKAFQYNEFTLSYQPKVDVHTNEIVGVEALIRWEHGKKGMIPPSTFIPIAEEIGMIEKIGEWVLREACSQFVKWQSSGLKPVIVAVNVSAVELQQSEFLKRVKKIIKETGMDPNYLEIEITENSIMQNTEECIDRMNQLREMGISLSIDDFGTGYSSMGYLQKFPINYLKIDKSFIKELFSQSGSAEIIKAMIQLGHTFGLKVVAEGVEGEQILSFIQNQDCDYYQGYFYSKPVEPELIKEKLLAYS
ncbi:sensor domain-containing protein [Gracilibacillus kekensis]|uniref:Diguanylate cyclase (GGDEF) domain-containing protein n=1 Tax=Gracilibacillus kekensis TaxID=1027249 RepID=A0A1M7QBU2_9BACI|nr:bifunctional diguanylate cyclase/phosphodiesterase [Gracilibacillus kekensis]SHN28121.1 diguanylate cyclase (GGDEF) domain-containing protein [Gracilibacillus kekensis]